MTLVAPSPFKLLCFGVINVAASVTLLALMVLFWVQADIVWAGSCLFFMVLSTILHILTTLEVEEATRTQKLLGVVLSILQLKPLVDAFEFKWNKNYANQSQHALKDSRAKRYLVTIINTLPICVLLTYITMLDLHDRINGHYLAFVVFIFFTAFAIGTAEFAGGSQGILIWIAVFVQSFAQFAFRALAVCSIWLRFAGWGVFGSAISWLSVYLFGPQGVGLLCVQTCRGTENSDATSTVPRLLGLSCARTFLTSLSFFIVIDALRESPDHPDSPVTAAESFQANRFMVWRLIENSIMLACFVFVPSSSAAYGREHYEEWLSDPLKVAGVSVIWIVMIVSTWWMIRSTRSAPQGYGRQMDEPKV